MLIRNPSLKNETGRRLGGSGSIIEKVGAGFVVFLGLLMLALLAVPMLLSLLVSFTPSDIIEVPGPGEFSLRWYTQFFNDKIWQVGAANSVLIALLTVLISLVVGTSAAYAFERYDFPGKKILQVFILLPLFVPPVVLGMQSLAWHQRIGLWGSPLSLAVAHSLWGVPLAFSVMQASFKNLDHRLEEAARGLGAPPLMVFWKITLPLVWPGLLVAAFFAFIISLNEFVMSLFLATPRVQTISTLIYPQLSYSLSAAGGLRFGYNVTDNGDCAGDCHLAAKITKDKTLTVKLMPMQTPKAEPFLRQLIEEQTDRRQDEIFLTFGGRDYTYGEIDRESNRVARIFFELGLKPLDRVGFFLPNGPEFIFGWLATIKLNLTLVPLNIQLKGPALEYIVRHSEPGLIFTNAALLPEIRHLTPGLAENCRVLVLNLSEEETASGLVSFEKLVGLAPADRLPDTRQQDEDPAMIIYTSGTTGHPKGVVIGRRAQTNHPLYYHKEMLRTAPGETAYCYLPLFHVTAQGTTMGSLLGGGRVALDTHFNVFGFWEKLRRHRAVTFPYLGAVLQMLHSRPQREDDTDNPVRVAFGAAAPAEIWGDFEKRFGLRLVETYGQSEWAAIWVLHPTNHTRIGAAGKAPDRAEVRVVGEDEQPLPPGELGQIVMRPHRPGLMMSGYYRQPELNARVFKDGWYLTGDAGEMDEDGYLYFRGRLKDYIRRRGENISAFEIERVVNTHPAVQDSAAVGIPSALGEEEVKLCVVLKPESTLASSEEELWQFCRDNLPRFMVPRYIEILPELPRTATQRVRKFLLAETGAGAAWDRKRARSSPK